jgi:hypothetical protein
MAAASVMSTTGGSSSCLAPSLPCSPNPAITTASAFGPCSARTSSTAAALMKLS